VACTSGECEICGATTTLGARLGRKGDLFFLFGRHRATSSPQALLHRRSGGASGGSFRRWTLTYNSRFLALGASFMA
jgi:hypothetical protein